MISKLYLAFFCILGLASGDAYSVVSTTKAHPNSSLGHYEFGVAIEKPSAIGEYNHYEVMYGEPSWYIKFQAAYYPLEMKYLAVGGRLSVGRYTDTGTPVSGVTPVYDQDINEDLLDNGQKTSLTMFPLDAGVDVRISPFLRDWMYFNTWVTAGTAFVQESLSVNSDTTEANSETLSSYVNKGWITSWKYGVSFAFNVTQIDRSTVTSIRNYGVSGVYFRPYYEKTMTIKSSLGNFDQVAYGIAFDFVSTY